MRLSGRLSPSVLALLATTAVFAPALARVQRGGPRGPVYPAGDHAVLELYTRLAADGVQRLGPHSRLHFHHPGPAQFYLSVPFYEMSGRRPEGLALAALAVAAASAFAILLLVLRAAGGTAFGFGLAGLSLWVSWCGPGILSYWNPNVAVLPLGAAAFGLAALAAARSGGLPVAAFFGSLAVQSHVGCAAALAAMAAAAALLCVPSLRRRLSLPGIGARSLVWPALLAAVVVVVLWAPPLLAELDGAEGNLRRIVDLAGSAAGRRPSAAQAVAALAEASTSFLLGSAATPARDRLLAPLLAPVVLIVLVGSAIRSRQGRSAYGLTAALLGLVGLGAALFGALRLPGVSVPSYLVQWVGMLSLLAASALGACLEGSAWGWRATLAALTVAGIVTAASLLEVRREAPAGAAPPSPEEAWVRALAEPSASAVRASGVRRALLVVERAVPRPVATGLLLGLDRDGVSLGVSRFGPYRFGGRFRPDGSEDATLLVGLEAAEGRAGARRLAGGGGVAVFVVPGDPAEGASSP